jgi:hypothetical protein
MAERAASEGYDVVIVTGDNVTLNVSLAGSQATISWSQPLWMTGYALKSTPSLSSPVWTTVTGVTNFSVNYSTTVTVGSGNQFFAVLKQ